LATRVNVRYAFNNDRILSPDQNDVMGHNPTWSTVLPYLADFRCPMTFPASIAPTWSMPWCGKSTAGRAFPYLVEDSICKGRPLSLIGLSRVKTLCGTQRSDEVAMCGFLPRVQVIFGS
jgi:hypothetical protein